MADEFISIKFQVITAVLYQNDGNTINYIEAGDIVNSVDRQPN